MCHRAGPRTAAADLTRLKYRVLALWNLCAATSELTHSATHTSLVQKPAHDSEEPACLH